MTFKNNINTITTWRGLKQVTPGFGFRPGRGVSLNTSIMRHRQPVTEIKLPISAT